MIAYKKPFHQIATQGQTQSTQDCKNLLQEASSQFFPNATIGKQWKRAAKYGSSPTQYRIFKNEHDVYALIVETPSCLALIGVDNDPDVLRNAKLQPELLHALGASMVERPERIENVSLVDTIHSIVRGDSIQQSKKILLSSLYQQMKPQAWKDMLHMEDHYTPQAIEQRAAELQAMWDERIEQGESPADAFYFLLKKLDLHSMNKKHYTMQNLLDRKAAVSLFTVTDFYNGNGESDADGAKPASFRADDAWGICVEHPLIEPDCASSLDMVYYHALEDLNGSCILGLTLDPSVADLEGITDAYTQGYVWLIERGFQTPNAPASAKKIVNMRLQMRAQERSSQMQPKTNAPHP